LVNSAAEFFQAKMEELERIDEAENLQETDKSR
jgi:hypothetical protein